MLGGSPESFVTALGGTMSGPFGIGVGFCAVGAVGVIAGTGGCDVIAARVEALMPRNPDGVGARRRPIHYRGLIHPGG